MAAWRGPGKHRAVGNSERKRLRDRASDPSWSPPSSSLPGPWEGGVNSRAEKQHGGLGEALGPIHPTLHEAHNRMGLTWGRRKQAPSSGPVPRHKDGGCRGPTQQPVTKNAGATAQLQGGLVEAGRSLRQGCHILPLDSPCPAPGCASRAWSRLSSWRSCSMKGGL